MGKTSIGLPNKKGDRSGAGEGKLKINSVKRCTILGQPPSLRKKPYTMGRTQRLRIENS